MPSKVTTIKPTDLEKVLLDWKRVITHGGAIDTYQFVEAALIVGQVILNVVPDMMREIKELQEWKARAINYYPDLERMEK